MATDVDFIEYVLEQAAFGHRLSHKRMFGEYALYLDEKVVAFACDNSLLLKPTEAGRAALPTVTLGKPYPEAKDYYVLDEFLDDTPLLQRLLQVTANALPAPKPKPERAGKAAARRKGGGGKEGR
ncbi:MAG TPA: TfoX/Sxy family protein [Luteimonas sp.]|nr:TfoX/Sxy family protein [Luteimonas sp.]